MVSREKSSLIVHNPQQLSQSKQSCPLQIQTPQPLWQRAPTRDKEGKPYADFMMLIPGLKKFDSEHIKDIINKINVILKQYDKYIVMADLNLKINILWVTIQPQLGLSAEIAALIHHVIPEAKLVSQHRVS